jgi:hypothetical protein
MSQPLAGSGDDNTTPLGVVVEAVIVTLFQLIDLYSQLKPGRTLLGNGGEMNLLAVIQQGAGLVEVKVGVGGGVQIYPVPPGLVHPPCCETISQRSETIHWAQKVPLWPGYTLI